jgi:magnesium-transporting ATPase (P-type)
MGDNLSQFLEPIAAWFRSLGTPAPIVHWGHPAMMGIVVFVLGSYVAYAGWRGRTATDAEISDKNRAEHRKLAPLMFLFLALGYTGGILSLVMQHEPILESYHFWTGSLVLLLLGTNATIAFTGFGSGQKAGLRTFHAYLGGSIMLLLCLHAFLGLQLGLSI